MVGMNPSDSLQIFIPVIHSIDPPIDPFLPLIHPFIHSIPSIDPFLPLFHPSRLKQTHSILILHNNSPPDPVCSSRAFYMPLPLRSPLCERQESHCLAEIHRKQLHVRKPDHFPIITQQLPSIHPHSLYRKKLLQRRHRLLSLLQRRIRHHELQRRRQSPQEILHRIRSFEITPLSPDRLPSNFIPYGNDTSQK